MRKSLMFILVAALPPLVLAGTISCSKKAVTVANQPMIESEQAGTDPAMKTSPGTLTQPAAATDTDYRKTAITRMLEDIYFEYDKSTLTPQARQSLLKTAEWLKSNSKVNVIIEGHCDERGTNEYNLALGDRRATSSKAFLVDLGVSPSRLVTISYGEEQPADGGHNERAWAKNRRAHFAVD